MNIMKINNQRLLLVLLLSSSGIYQTQADPIQVNITGKVKASPCTVDTISVNQTVDFGQVQNNHLQTAGEASDWQPFEVKLINCPTSTTVATVTFTGTPSTEDATLYANAGTASNVAVQMAQDSDKTLIQGNGSTMNANVDAQNFATYNLAARLMTPSGNAGAGTISSVVLMTFTYQ